MIIDLSEPIYLTVLQPVKAWQVHSTLEQMEENAQSHGDAWHAFIHGWAIHTSCKLPVPQWEAPYILNTDKASREPEYIV